MNHPLEGTRAVRFWVFVMFTASGFSGLIYESIWSHYLKLILGHAAYAHTLVLAMFMGGLAAGAWIISRVTSRIGQPLLWYVAIEFAIGVLGLLFHSQFGWWNALLFDTVLPALDWAPAATASKWIIAAVLLLPQAVLLGTTFPLISAAIVRMDPNRSGSTLSTLYFTNSLGAAAGVLTSGFLLVPWVGLPGTTLTAGLINITVALVLYFPARRPQLPAAQPQPPARQEAPGLLRLLLVVAGITGLASFLYEIAWIRLLSLVLGSSSHAFELMLSAFILGLAIGALLIRRRTDSGATPLVLLAWIQLAMGVLAALTIPVYDASFPAMSQLIDALRPTDTGYALFNLGSHGIAMMIMLPATIAAGTTLPLITNSLLRAGQSEGAIGRVYAVNTIGAIAAVALATGLLMPLLGARAMLALGAGLDCLLGLALLLWLGWGHLSVPRRVLAAALTLIPIGAALWPADYRAMAAGVYRQGTVRLPEDDRVLFYQDGRTSTIAVVEHADTGISIRTNGKTDALIKFDHQPPAVDEITMVMAAALPLALRPNLTDAANIGMGSGLTTHTLLAAPSVQRVDTIEIEAAMVRGAQLFGDRVERAWHDPRSHIHIDDARTFFSGQGRRYDVIVSEPSNPWISGVASLFTREFYELAHRHLKPAGLFVQWLQLYSVDETVLSSVAGALGRAFPHYAFYMADTGNLLIVASDAPVGKLRSDRLNEPDLARELARVRIHSVDDLRLRYLGNRTTLEPWLQAMGAPPNSDFFPVVANQAPRLRFRGLDLLALTTINSVPINAVDWIESLPPLDTVTVDATGLPAARDLRNADHILRGAADQIPPGVLRLAVSLVQSECGSVDGGIMAEALLRVARVLHGNAAGQAIEGYWQGLETRCAATGWPSPADHVIALQTSIATGDLRRARHHAEQTLGLIPGAEVATYLWSVMLAADLALDEPTRHVEFMPAVNSLADSMSGTPQLRMLIDLAEDRAPR